MPKSSHVDKDFTDFESPHEASVDRLIKAVDRAYHRPWLMMWRSFLQGMMAAVGAMFGTAVVAVGLVYLFQALGGISLLKPFTDSIVQSIDARTGVSK
ncbi:MAG: hypothetical protein WCO52_02460 [bacterium]